MRLDASDLLEQMTLVRSEEGRIGAGQVLQFTLDMKVEGLAPAPPPATPVEKKAEAP